MKIEIIITSDKCISKEVSEFDADDNNWDFIKNRMDETVSKILYHRKKFFENKNEKQQP